MLTFRNFQHIVPCTKWTVWCKSFIDYNSQVPNWLTIQKKACFVYTYITKLCYKNNSLHDDVGSRNGPLSLHCWHTFSVHKQLDKDHVIGV